MFFAEGVLVGNCDALQYLALHYNLQINPASRALRKPVEVVQRPAYSYV